ncbi:MAG: FAD-binding protein [Elusimicrobia bacterium]|nr:FAD-binding protein [Elusimicrobiota bacterium]
MKAAIATDESLRRLYARDQGDVPPLLRWAFSTPPSGVAQPATEQEAAEAVRLAYENGTPLVFRGAGSSAFGQSVPVLGGLALDVSFLKSVRRFEPDAGTVTVDAGARWSDLAAFLAERGFAFGSYPSSWYSTVGGWVQTGGCGMLTHRFGPLREQVTGLRVCVGEGRLLDLDASRADFDAFFQTEGQLGLVLQVTLKIRRKPQGEFPLAVDCKDLADAWELAALARKEVASLAHVSIYNAARVAHFNRGFAQRMRAKGSEVAARPLVDGAPLALLYVETREAWTALRDWLRRRGRAELPAHVGSYLWAERFFPLKGKAADQSLLGNELVVADEQAAAYCGSLEALARRHGVEPAIEANAAGPGESVVIASFPVSGGQARFLSLLPLVLRLDRLGTESYGGRLYHVGTYNTPFIERKFSPERLEKLREAKRRLDPKGLFNPGKFFELKTRWTTWLSAERHRRAARWLLPTLEERPFLAALLARLAWLAPAGREASAAGDPLAVTARECVNCGFCLPVCPAYLATRDERTTARGKLGLASAFLAGRKLSVADVELLHSCMHCGACTAVCQNTLDLVPAWRALEERVATAAGGKPAARIEAFVKDVEASADYKRLLRRGYITERAA